MSTSRMKYAFQKHFEYHLSFLFKEKGWSAIFYAAWNRDDIMSKLLCRAGANLSLLDNVMPMDLHVSVL